jgi:hypothetical protein
MALGDDLIIAITEKAATEAIRRYGFPTLDNLRTLIGALYRTRHPSLNELREICDYLAAFLPQKCGPIDASFKFPNMSEFTRQDMKPKEIANLWFRMDSLTDEMQTSIKEWISVEDRHQYFYGNANFDYGDDDIKQRHPVFKKVQPFIMLSRADRKKPSADTVNDVLRLFIDSWWAFVQPGYTEFRIGKVVQVEDQAFAEGYIRITNQSQFRWKQEQIAGNVNLWRCLMVTVRPDCVDTMNIGIPVSETGGHGQEYLKHFRDWMQKFMALAREGKH